MNYLLDTHTLLFCAFGSPKLGAKANRAILSPENTVYVSDLTFWEISLKYSIGKLELSGIGPYEMPTIALKMGFEPLALATEDASTFHRLPRGAHRDPFDRILACQAIRRGYVLISCDSSFRQYAGCGLQTVW